MSGCSFLVLTVTLMKSASNKLLLKSSCVVVCCGGAHWWIFLWDFKVDVVEVELIKDFPSAFPERKPGVHKILANLPS